VIVLDAFLCNRCVYRSIVMVFRAEILMYCREHYIPHRRSDPVNGTVIPRAARRVSLTFRETRGYACTCHFPEYCDSQKGALPPTRLAQLQQQQQQGGGEAADILHERECGAGNGRSSSSADAGDSVGSCRGGGPTIGLQSCSKGTGMQQSSSSSKTDEGASGTAAAASPQEPVAGVSAQHLVAGDGVDSDPEAAAEQMEAAFVHQVYDAIAPHFSATRFAIWPKVSPEQQYSCRTYTSVYGKDCYLWAYVQG
jgi:hypothetical protein